MPALTAIFILLLPVGPPVRSQQGEVPKQTAESADRFRLLAQAQRAAAASAQGNDDGGASAEKSDPAPAPAAPAQKDADADADAAAPAPAPAAPRAPAANENPGDTSAAPQAPQAPQGPGGGDGPGQRPGGGGRFGPGGGGFGQRGGGGFGPGGGAPGGGGGVDGSAPISGLTETPNGEVRMQYPLNPVSDLLNIYEQIIGKTIIKDTTVFDGPQVSLVTPNPVTRQEAARLIEATLQVNGYVIVAEPDVQSVKVLFGGQRPGGQSASFSEGVVIYTSEESLPGGESLVGYFMELEYIDPEAAATIFGNHVVLNEFGRITPVTHPRGLLITESSAILRQFIKLRQIVDVPTEEAPLMTEFARLEYAEASIVAQIIQAAMDARMEERQRQSDAGKTVSGQRASNNGGDNNNNNNRSSSSSSSQPQVQYVRGPDGRMVPAGGNNSGIGTADMPAAQLIADDRLNRIMVVSAPSDLAYILDLIKQFDQPLETRAPMERPLRYVKANDVLPVIVDVLQDTGTGQTQLPGGRQIETRPTPVTSAQLATLTGTTAGRQNNQNRTTQTATGTDTAGSLGERPDQIAFPIDDVAPISVLVGKTRLIADRQANSIIVIGNRENQDIVLDIIDRLDRRPLQVYLATVIGELTLTDDFQFGIDYLQKFTQFSGDNPNDGGVTGGLINAREDIIGATNTTGNIADLRDNLISTPFGPLSGLNVYGQIGESLDVFVSALESTQNFKVLSRPVVYTQNGKRAEITSGQEVPYPETALTDTNNPSAVRSTVAYKDVVLKLEVLPTINENNEVTLDIVQINDRVVGQQVVDQNEIPVIGKQELNTTVTIPNRSTIVLGGLISERDELTDSGLPFLKNIPLVGNAVKSTITTKARTELMIFIQPIVVDQDGEVYRASLDEDVRSEIGEAAAATFPEPGVPTAKHETLQAELRENEEKRGLLGKVGRKLFGKKKEPSRPVLIEKLPEGETVAAPPEVPVP